MKKVLNYIQSKPSSKSTVVISHQVTASEINKSIDCK
jgi:hypothetical protein